MNNTDSLLQVLRTATRDAHEALHHHPVLKDLASAGLTRDYWLTALQKFFGFYQPLELQYAKTGSALLADFPAGIIIENLRCDMAAENIDANLLDIAAHAAASWQMEKILAYLYVREGSNLGGRLISKNLERTLGVKGGDANRFFWGHGDATGQKWKLFMEKLLHYQDQCDAQKVGSHAAQFFQDLGSWLSKPASMDGGMMQTENHYA